ncbi:MFS transporter-like protein [Cenococcum geophilum]
MPRLIAIRFIQNHPDSQRWRLLSVNKAVLISFPVFFFLLGASGGSTGWGVLQRFEDGCPVVEPTRDLSHLKRDGNIILQPQPSDSANDPLNCLDQVSSLMIGFFAFWVGFTTFFTASGANIWGKRPFFGRFTTTNFSSLAAMRVLQGIASVPLETLITSTVSDLFFRLRGICTLILVLILPLMYFFVLETTYTAPRAETIELQGKGSFWTIEMDDKKSYWKRLAIFRGWLSNESHWKGVVKPLPPIAYPAVLFSTIVYGTFSPNVYMTQVGLTNISLLPVVLIGSPLSGWLADTTAKVMDRHNSGVFEPEFRLTLMLIAVSLSTAGFLGFGMSVEQKQPLVWLLLFALSHALSVGFATQASLTHLIVVLRMTINFAKAVFTFLTITYVNGLGIRCDHGYQFGVYALTIPAYVFGKRVRSMIWIVRL